MDEETATTKRRGEEDEYTHYGINNGDNGAEEKKSWAEISDGSTYLLAGRFG
jgi:hypothetical protein